MVLFRERVHHGNFFRMRNASGPGGPLKGRVLRCHFQGEEAWQLYSQEISRHAWRRRVFISVVFHSWEKEVALLKRKWGSWKSSGALDSGGTRIRRVAGGWPGRGVAAPAPRCMGRERLRQKFAEKNLYFKLRIKLVLRSSEMLRCVD
jgi:hypothetical protein